MPASEHSDEDIRIAHTRRANLARGLGGGATKRMQVFV